jgi:hypothetical protein
MADRVTVVSPRDPWPLSTVTVDDLEALVVDGLLRLLFGDPQLEWVVPAGEVVSTPPPGYVVSFVSFHERGFGVHASRFMRALLHYYGVELHNFNPNSIAQAAIFAAVCEGFLGVDPHWDLWTHIFSAELFALTTGGKEGPHGGASRWLHPPVEAGARAAVHPRHPCVFEQGVAALVVLPPERRRKASVVFSTSGDRGHTRETRESPASSGGLAEVARWGAHRCGVVAAIHRRWVLPLAERRLPLSEMKPGVDLEGSQMSSAPLSNDDLRRRVAGTVGRLDAGALTQPVMRPERGYVSLVSVRSFFYLVPGRL